MQPVDKAADQKPLHEQIWGKSMCIACGSTIKQGEPRAVVMIFDLDYGPGHPEYDPEEEHGDEGNLLGFGGKIGPRSNAHAFCEVCVGEKLYFKILNSRYIIREGNAADDDGPSVRTISVSRLKEKFSSSSDDPEDDNGEVEDIILSGGDNPAPAPPTEDELRGRVFGLLRSSKSQSMPVNVRRVAKLWAEGKNQNEIAHALGISQPSVSRAVNAAKARLYRA